MPASSWNGKYQAVGNGAFSGAIAYPGDDDRARAGLCDELHRHRPRRRQRAALRSDIRRRSIDFGWRAVHEMTAASKKIIAAYYDAAPKFSYWNGCSAGGRQAMKEAQRFPADFDGIIAGAPGLDWTGRAAQAVRVAKSAGAERSGAAVAAADAAAASRPSSRRATRSTA